MTRSSKSSHAHLISFKFLNQIRLPCFVLGYSLLLRENEQTILKRASIKCIRVLAINGQSENTKTDTSYSRETVIQRSPVFSSINAFIDTTWVAAEDRISSSIEDLRVLRIHSNTVDTKLWRNTVYLPPALPSIGTFIKSCAWLYPSNCRINSLGIVWINGKSGDGWDYTRRVGRQALGYLNPISATIPTL